MQTARHALCPVVRVNADDHPPLKQAASSVFAVFSTAHDPAGCGRFIGLVTPGQINGQQDHTFAMLLPQPAPPAVSAQTSLNQVVAHLDQEHADAVAVLDECGAFVGAVTRASLLDALLLDESALYSSEADTLHDIAQMLSASSGESLFHKLVLSLSKVLDLDHAFVGELSPHDDKIIQTIAICSHGQIVENIKYPLVTATACGSVGCQTVCYVPEGSQQLYPEDTVLNQFKAEAFIGHPLLGASGQLLGLLAILHSKPLTNPEQIQSVLQICATRVVAELERQYAEQETRQMQSFLDSVVENLPNMLFVKDARDLRFVRVNKAAEELLGMAREELLSKNVYDLFPAAQADFFTAKDREVLNEGVLLDIPHETVHTRHKGERLLHTRKIPILDEAGEPLYLLGISEDITERRLTEDRAARLGRILERSSNEIYVFDAQSLKFTQVNQGALHNLGFSFDELRELTPIDLTPDFTTADFLELIEPLRCGTMETLSFEVEHRRKDGSLYPIEAHVQYSSVEIPPVFVAVMSDITERKQAQQHLNYLAFYDTLTGLPNRQLLLDRLRQAMLEAMRHERLVAVMFLDLDRFKLVNDTLGHGAGDHLLKDVATRLSACVRSGDTIARLGGDEFTIILANVAHVDDVTHVAQKVLAVFAQPYMLTRQEVFVTPSIGITLYPLDDTDAEMLLKNADAAMYHAKDSGRNTFQFFTPALNARATRRLGLETALRYALERDEFVLHYQPQVDLSSGQIMGVEALIRWQQSDTELISPLDFIPLAEETGLIVPIGEWVLRRACEQAQAWQQAGLPALHMSVNIAARQFQQQDLAKVVARVLSETGLEPGWLTLEITESTVMLDPSTTIKTLQQIGELGVGLSLDDFGTGYSSLSYLKRFPLHYLKIDKSFVDDITTDPDDAAIATAIISLADSLELKVIAEGVETMAQLNFLCARGCDAMQGYYFSKPLPLAACTALLKAGTRLKPGPVAKPKRTREKSAAQARPPATKQRKTAKRKVAKKKIAKRKTAKRKTAKKK